MVSFFEEYPETRSAYWDNIKSVLIALVVFAHCLYGLQDRYWNDIIVDAIYYFHMPAFVFVSGFFSKSENSRSAKSLVKLVSAYLIYEGAFAIADVYLGNQPCFVTPYNSAWYLLALIAWRVLVPYFAKLKLSLVFVTIVAIVAGFWPDLGGQPVLAVKKIVTFFPFFLAGYLMSESAVDAITNRNKVTRVVIGCLCLALVIAGESLSHSALHITDHDLLPNAYNTFGVTEPLARISIIVVASLFIVAMLHLSINKPLPFLSRIGKNSLSIYLLHRPFTLAFATLLTPYATLVQIVAACILTIAILIITGSDVVSLFVNRVLDRCASFLLRSPGLEPKSG